MELLVQLAMGLGLAACAGLRAWLPLLCLGLLTRAGYVELAPAFAFLGRTDMLIVFGVATVLELLGDKIVAVDNVLDAAGTVVRPLAGALLATSVVTHADPGLSLVLGLILGGGTAFTINAGKAAIRAKSTALAPVHGGTGNMALSVGEDLASLGGIGLSVWLPLVAAVFVLLALYLAVRLVRSALHHGRRFVALFRRPEAPKANLKERV